MTNASLAVVISTYNKPDFLRLVLEGYRQQTDRNFTIYIADDGSTQETKHLIQEIKNNFPVQIHHIWQEDKGFRKSRIHNKTIATIQEPTTLLTDGDCIPLPSCIATHRNYSNKGHFINGSRILLSKELTHQLCQKRVDMTTRSATWWVRLRISGQINRLLPMFIPPFLSPSSQKLSGIRGCHLSCPTDALKQINGFDESYEGWGREDSDLTARLLHAGLSRRNLVGSPVLHLWHQEESRQHLKRNDTLLQDCLDNKRIRAISGIEELEHE